MATQLTAKPGGSDVLSIAETKAYDALEGEFAEVRAHFWVYLLLEDGLTFEQLFCACAVPLLS